ncbi:PLP-dependent transferase [Atractiella rhizophila]|nr:PLP-dependent transferase [Atractiella rhizophila]
MLDFNELEFNKVLSTLVEVVTRHRRDLSDRPILPPPFPSDNEHRIPTMLPIQSQSLEHTFSLLCDEILPRLGTYNSPRFFGFVTGGVTDASLLADMLLPSLDRHVQVHSPLDPLPALLEALTLHFVLSLLSPPSSPTLLQERFASRTLTTGATSSNILGLACGRDFVLQQYGVSVADDGFAGHRVVVLHAASHASVSKAASLVGIGRKQCYDLGVGGREWDFDLEKLEERLKEAKEKGDGVIVVAQLGEVNTGGMTADLPAIRQLCNDYDAWLHIDGAFGAFAALLPTLFPTVSRDLALADSLTLDGHKWLNVPYDCALFYSRSRTLQTSVFGINAAYLSTSSDKADADVPLIDPLPPLKSIIPTLESPLNMGIENSRRFRALPLFASLICLGREGYTDIVSRNIAFARQIVSWMREEKKDDYEVLLPPNVDVLNVVLFKSRKGTGAEMVKKINEQGRMFVTGTKWRGEDAARLAVSNWMTGLDHGKGKEEDWVIVKRVLEKVASEMA